jgi:hypothetical protein
MLNRDKLDRRIDSVLKGCAIAAIVCWIIICFAVLPSCTPPYPPCDQLDATRCNGNVIEECQPDMKWHPNIRCDEVYIDGVSTPETCIEVDDGHDCGVD